MVNQVFSYEKILGDNSELTKLSALPVSLSKSLAVSVLVFAIANLVLGWGLGVWVLTRWREGFAAMVPGTAICFAVLASSQILRMGLGRGRLVLSTVLSATVPGLAALFNVMPGAGLLDIGPSDRMSLATEGIVIMLAFGQLTAGRFSFLRGWLPAVFVLLALAQGAGGLAAGAPGEAAQQVII